MRRRPLIGALIASLVFEVFFAAGALFAPETTLGQFGLGVTPDTRFLAFGLGWTFVVISAFIALAIKLVIERDRLGRTLSLLLGSWWVVVGVAIFLKWGKIENLFVDSLKGAVIVAFAIIPEARPRPRPESRS